MNAARLAGTALLVLAAACTREPPASERVDGWALARASLTSGEHCFAGRREYCLDDPAFVDAAIRPRLDELYGGEMPLRRVHAEAVVRAAAQNYRRAQMTPANVAKVEELVRQRYENPRVSTSDEVISVDMGVVPGKLEGASATLGLRMAASEHVERGEWRRSELERVLQTYVGKYPEKKVVRIAVGVATERGIREVVYRWMRDERRLVIQIGDEARTTRRLADLPALFAPELPLGFDRLAACRISRLEPPPDQDPPSICPPDVPPRATTPRTTASGG
jgi:hypothetical protein